VLTACLQPYDRGELYPGQGTILGLSWGYHRQANNAQGFTLNLNKPRDFMAGICTRLFFTRLQATLVLISFLKMPFLSPLLIVPSDGKPGHRAGILPRLCELPELTNSFVILAQERRWYAGQSGSKRKNGLKKLNRGFNFTMINILLKITLHQQSLAINYRRVRLR
jgi:hypothetical protein